MGANNFYQEIPEKSEEELALEQKYKADNEKRVKAKKHAKVFVLIAIPLAGFMICNQHLWHVGIILIILIGMALLSID